MRLLQSPVSGLLVYCVFYFYGSLDEELHGWRWKDYTPYGFALCFYFECFVQTNSTYYQSTRAEWVVKEHCVTPFFDSKFDI
jgi:hypothetical protein